MEVAIVLLVALVLFLLSLIVIIRLCMLSTCCKERNELLQQMVEELVSDSLVPDGCDNMLFEFDRDDDVDDEDEDENDYSSESYEFAETSLSWFKKHTLVDIENAQCKTDFSEELYFKDPDGDLLL